MADDRGVMHAEHLGGTTDRADAGHVEGGADFIPVVHEGSDNKCANLNTQCFSRKIAFEKAQVTYRDDGTHPQSHRTTLMTHSILRIDASARAQGSVTRDLTGRITADRKSTRLNSSHSGESRMPSSA